MIRPIVWIAAVATLSPAVATAQGGVAPTESVSASQPDAALHGRIVELVDVLQGKGDYDAYFAPAFRAQVPREAIGRLTVQFSTGHGPLRGVEKIAPLSQWSANVTVGYRDGAATMRISVDPLAPHRVTGLLVTGFTAREKTPTAVVQAFRTLPGRTGLAIAQLGEGRPRLLYGHNADRPLAVGSAFKLVILAELVRATNAGERKWTDRVVMDGRPLPGGAYAMTLKGMEFPLSEVAAKMISVSDNSATDILLQFVGREKVEAMLTVLGVADPKRNLPMMSTLDMFKLKGVAEGALAKRYLERDTAGRRALLDGEIAQVPLGAVDRRLFRDGKPVLIDELEWFFSATDLVRIMDWIRRNTATGPGVEARKILSLNPGIAPDSAARWQFVGYKGGSEPGVMNMTLLLGGKDGRWYVVAGSWNNSAASLAEARLAGLMSSAAGLIAP